MGEGQKSIFLSIELIKLAMIRSYREVLPRMLIYMVETRLKPFNKAEVQMIVNMVRKRDVKESYLKRAQKELNYLKAKGAITQDEEEVFRNVIEWIAENIGIMKLRLFNES